MARNPSKSSRGGSGGAHNDWRRRASPGYGSFWNLLWRRPLNDSEIVRRSDPKRRAYVLRARLSAALITVAILVAVVVVIVNWPWATQTPLVAVAVTDYSFPVAPNAYALEDLAAFHALGFDEKQRATRTNLRWVGKPPDERTRGSKILDDLRAGLKDPNCVPGGAARNVVLVYLSAHGVVNGKGEACLLESDCDPLDAASPSWLPMRMVLEAVREELNANASRWGKKEVNAVVFLDCSRAPEDWRLGQLYNSFSERLEVERDRANDPRLVVISSAGLGESNHAEPALGGSTFGFFLRVGLSGAAARGRESNITLSGLVEYLSDNVDAWSRSVHGRGQTVRVFGQTEKNSKLALAFSGGADRFDSRGMSRAIESEKARRQEEVEKERQWVLANSQIVAKRYLETALLEHSPKSLHPASHDPLAWGRLRQKLLHLDRLLLAGRHYHKDGNNAFVAEHEEVLRLLENLQTPRLELGKWATSFALAAQLEPGSVSPRGSPIELGPLKASWEKALQAASEGKLQRADLQVADTAAGGAANREQLVEPVEIHFLRMLSAHAPRETQVEAEFARALLARQLAERAAAPADARAHPWIRTAVDEGDAARRLAEDRLFVGSPESLEKLKKDWPRVLGAEDEPGSYQRAESLAGILAKAFRRRDESWADAPYLADWVLARAQENAAADIPRVEVWLKSLDQLSAQLLAPPPEEGPSNEEIERLQRLERELGVRHAELLDSYARSRPDPSALRIDQAQVRRIEELLRRPPLDPATSKALHANEDVRGKYVAYLFSREQPGGLTPGASEESAEDRERLQRHNLWQHPLPLLCVERARSGDEDGPRREEWPESAEDQFQALARYGERLRVALQGAESAAAGLENQALDLFSAALSGEGAPAGAAKPDLNASLASAARRRLGEADLTLRRAAPLLAIRPNVDPSLQLARLDAATQFLWHARRSLEDFWGPWPRDNEPYFGLASRRGLEGAEAAWPRPREARLLAGGLLALREERLAAASPTRGVLPLPTEADLAAEGPLLAQKISFDLVGNIPPGEAAAYVCPPAAESAALTVFADLENDSRSWNRRAVSLALPAAEGLAHRLARADVENAQSLRAATLFRGHVRTREFPIYRPGQAEVVAFEKPKLAAPRITVAGSTKYSKHVVFIFDCSYSMYELLADPGPEQGRRRIDVAKEALNTILAELPDDTFKVGLRVYGHRAGWFQDRRAGVRYSELFPDAKAKTMQAAFELGKGPPPPLPSNDVEEVFKPLPLNDELRAQIRGYVAGLVPHGETPLCYAIWKAFDDLAKDQAGVVDRQIVVLTDGFNFQATGVHERLLDSKALMHEGELQSRLQANKQRFGNIRLDIVGFAMGKPTVDSAASLARLRAITAQQQGKFRPADNLSALITELNDSIVLPMYEVRLEASEGNAEQVRLGKTWHADNDWRPPAGKQEMPYVVSLPVTRPSPSSRVLLEGGESLRLIYQAPLLAHEFYAPDTRFVQDGAAMNVAEGPYHVTAFVPERVGRSVEFPIAVQHARSSANLFSGRPRHVWAEIRPIEIDPLPAGSPPVYHCYDPVFENDTPKPVLRFSVPSWPRDAKRAQIKIWFRAHDDPRAPLTATLPWKGGNARDLELPQPQYKGIRFDIETKEDAGVVQVQVIERHDRSQPRDVVLRVRAFPEPDRGSHAYYPEARMVKHHFVYLQGRPQKIEIATREDLQSGALALPDGKAIEVTLPSR